MHVHDLDILLHGMPPLVEAVFIGIQECPNGSGVPLYNIVSGGTEAHPNGSTVSERTLRSMGWAPPGDRSCGLMNENDPVSFGCTGE